MNYFFPSLSLVFVFVSVVHAAPFKCKKSVDPKKAVVFIDGNFGLTEMKAAAEAACDRGEGFIRIPEATPGEEAAHQDLERLTYVNNKIENIESQAEKIDCVLPSDSLEEDDGVVPNDPDSCQNLIHSFGRFTRESDELTMSTEAFMKKVKTLYSDAPDGNGAIYSIVEKGVKAIANRGIRPTSIIISGHSNGASVGGQFGWMLHASLQKQIIDAYANSKELLSDLKSLYLWGCNTLSPYSPEKWTEIFPTLDIIGGFEGSAPSNLSANSWKILSGILHQERTILANSAAFKTSDEVVSTFSAIPGVSGTVAAFYLHDRAQDRKWIYERTMDKDSAERTFWNVRATELMSAKDCAPVAGQIKSDQAYIDSILAGTIPIPEETSSGPLREAYTRSRRDDICRAALGYSHSADQIGLLLFWHGVKRNAMWSLENTTEYRGNEVPTSSVIAQYFSGDLVRPEFVLASVSQANEENAANLSKQKSALEENLDKYKTSKNFWVGRLSSAAESYSLLPWTKSRQRELRRLFRQERRLKRKSRHRPEFIDALGAVHLKVSQYIDAKKSGVSGLNTAIEKYRSALMNWEKYAATLTTAITKLAASPIVTDGQGLLADLHLFSENLKPKSVSEIEKMSYSEVLEKSIARRAALSRIEKATIISPPLWKKYSALVASAKWWQERFEQTVITPKAECMEFLPWHEYEEKDSAEERPYFQCHYSI